MIAHRLFPALLLVAALAACGKQERRVEAERYDAFWLWAGVEPQPVLTRARTIYLLDSEVRAEGPRLVDLRPQAPRLAIPEVWLVVRVETLHWPEGTAAALVRRLDGWRAAGNKVAGLQVDFDARTRHLDEYADFLRRLRRSLPERYRLSITGLLDWSANGDPRALEGLAGVVDEVVLQTYQGRHTIPGYADYFGRMGGFRLPFRVGLVQGGEWTPPPGLEDNPFFRGYVVFLLNAPRNEYSEPAA